MEAKREETGGESGEQQHISEGPLQKGSENYTVSPDLKIIKLLWSLAKVI
jgi:hypothetical protein